MARSKASHNQASPAQAFLSGWDPTKTADVRLTHGDFRLILSALYLYQEREIDPHNRRARIRLGLIAMHIHDALSSDTPQ